jgi:hypothetical protein
MIKILSRNDKMNMTGLKGSVNGVNHEGEAIPRKWISRV